MRNRAIVVPGWLVLLTFAAAGGAAVEESSFCLMWENKGADAVSVRGAVER